MDSDLLGALAAGFGMVILVVAVVGGLANDIQTSGAGEPNTRNYVTSETMCAPTVGAFEAFQKLARNAYDTGAPITAETRATWIAATESVLLQVGTEVVVDQKGSGGLYTLVNPQIAPRTTLLCWVHTKDLKMGWSEWFAWKRSEQRKASQGEEALAERANLIRQRASHIPAAIVACRTGITEIHYQGTAIADSFPVDVSRCLSRGGTVRISGPPNGIVYLPNGQAVSHLDRNRMVGGMSLAGPKGTTVRIECSCSSVN